ncbi:WD40/YVTN/BNR-like repeat-containing protein [Ktedonobacter racemifer]|uniref:Photosynthesis system II assembly factor Ycf48/Hcf136-like domain-containing protein n=1 Tax=Ktedonobacter racemifer DSM 44963 TaxID=485913 RepID=D6U0T6_KTERA|nr:YCF48-related protein [Ktedonobacter racemifer]EFH82426.1 hypothetical protein Krac_3237 [Ktedonobacter racemifer DSM 44963]
MRNKNIFSTISTVLALAALLLLAACGSGGTTSASSSTATPTLSTTQTPATAETPVANSTLTTTLPSSVKGPLTAIRMLTTQQGWAMTANAILKTTDGGRHWTNVTPSNAPGYQAARGTFIDNLYVWVVSAQETQNKITIQHTTDGGQTWSSITLDVQDPASVDMLHFSGNEGWFEAITSPGAGSQGAYIFRTTDAGQTWKLISQAGRNGLPLGGFKSGLSFKDASTVYATIRSTTGQPTDPGLYVSRDGGFTWQEQQLTPPVDLTVQQIGTTPPIFFGSTGLLPVYVTTPDGHAHLVLYHSNDGGSSWFPTLPIETSADSTYIADTSHAWVSDWQSGKLFYTTDGGKSWQTALVRPGKLKEMSFADANNGWAVTESQLLHTWDGGKTWGNITYTNQ